MTRAAPRIAYQGEPGANSHLVCREHYPDHEALACASFEDVFAAARRGEVMPQKTTYFYPKLVSGLLFLET